MRNQFAGAWREAHFTEQLPIINEANYAVFYHAVSMHLDGYKDDDHVELRIQTDNDEQVVITCFKDAVFLIQQYYEQIGSCPPSVANWQSVQETEDSQIRDMCSYDNAVWEGWNNSKNNN